MLCQHSATRIKHRCCIHTIREELFHRLLKRRRLEIIVRDFIIAFCCAKWIGGAMAVARKDPPLSLAARPPTAHFTGRQLLQQPAPAAATAAQPVPLSYCNVWDGFWRLNRTPFLPMFCCSKGSWNMTMAGLDWLLGCLLAGWLGG